MKDVLEAMKVMGNQVVAMTQLFTPLVNSLVGQATPMAMTTLFAYGWVMDAAEVVDINSPVRSVRKVDYLSLLEHISRLGTKHFSDSTNPIIADKWRSWFVWNFRPTRCPEDYNRENAVHFLEGYAQNWWLALDKRTNGNLRSFADFKVEFNSKYFPAEAWDILESKS